MSAVNPHIFLEKDELCGMVKEVLSVKEGVSKNGKTWKRKEILIETNETYPRKVVLQAWGEVADLEIIKEGALLVFGVEVRSRKYQESWYTDVQVIYVRS